MNDQNDTLITYTVACSATEYCRRKIEFINTHVVALEAIRNYDFQRDYIKVNTSEIHCSYTERKSAFPWLFLPSSRSLIARGMVQLPPKTKSGRQAKQFSSLILKTLKVILE